MPVLTIYRTIGAYVGYEFRRNDAYRRHGQQCTFASGFSSDPIDPSGYGEGENFIGFQSVATGASGNISFNIAFHQIRAGQRVTATATDPAGNTSEFSGAIGQLLNISTRLNVQTGARVLIGGFIITGSESKSILVRGLGPTLAQPPFIFQEY